MLYMHESIQEKLAQDLMGLCDSCLLDSEERQLIVFAA
jgi:hypothetical protein